MRLLGRDTERFSKQVALPPNYSLVTLSTKLLLAHFPHLHEFLAHIYIFLLYMECHCDIINLGSALTFLLRHYSIKIEVLSMDVCYNKLFKLLIDKGMKKTDLRLSTGISPNTLTKLSNNQFVSMEVLVKICRVLHCDIGDIMEVAPCSGKKDSKSLNNKEMM